MVVGLGQARELDLAVRVGERAPHPEQGSRAGAAMPSGGERGGRRWALAVRGWRTSRAPALRHDHAIDRTVEPMARPRQAAIDGVCRTGRYGRGGRRRGGRAGWAAARLDGPASGSASGCGRRRRRGRGRRRGGGRTRRRRRASASARRSASASARPSGWRRRRLGLGNAERRLGLGRQVIPSAPAPRSPTKSVALSFVSSCCRSPPGDARSSARRRRRRRRPLDERVRPRRPSRPRRSASPPTGRRTRRHPVAASPPV